MLWIVFGIGIGILSALRRHSVMDRALDGRRAAARLGAGILARAGAAVPVLLDIGKFKILPGAGSYVGLTSDPWKWFTSLLMPWFVLAAGSAAVFARLMRGNLLEVMDEDYIRTARAKGLPEKQVVRQQGVRASINPVVTADGPRIRAAARAARCWWRRCSTSPAWAGSRTNRSSTPTSK